MSDAEIWWTEYLAARCGLEFDTVDNLLRSGWEYFEKADEPPKWINKKLQQARQQGEHFDELQGPSGDRAA